MVTSPRPQPYRNRTLSHPWLVPPPFPSSRPRKELESQGVQRTSKGCPWSCWRSPAETPSSSGAEPGWHGAQITDAPVAFPEGLQQEGFPPPPVSVSKPQATLHPWEYRLWDPTSHRRCIRCLGEDAQDQKNSDGPAVQLALLSCMTRSLFLHLSEPCFPTLSQEANCCHFY